MHNKKLEFRNKIKAYVLFRLNPNSEENQLAYDYHWQGKQNEMINNIVDNATELSKEYPDSIVDATMDFIEMYAYYQAKEEEQKRN